MPKGITLTRPDHPRDGRRRGLFSLARVARVIVAGMLTVTQ